MERPDRRPPWLIIAQLLCLMLGCATIGCCALYLLAAWLKEPDWASVNGTVISTSIDAREVTQSRISTVRGGTYRYPRYQPEISYRYQVGGRDYLGDGIGDGVDSTYSDRQAAVAVLASYTRGALIVYYDPANPSRSALDIGIVSRMVLIAGCAGLLLVALGFALRYAGSIDEGAPMEDENGEEIAAFEP